MTAKRRFPLILGLALLTAGGCAGDDSRQPGPAQDEGWPALYEMLATGDCLYVGTVEDMVPEPARRYSESGCPQVEEKGELRFAVERTLFGERVAELRMHYVYTRADNQLVSDEGGSVWDDHPPRRGMRLALLIYGEKHRKQFAEAVKREGPILCIWPAPKGSSFIQELTEACGFLTATGGDDRMGLVKCCGGSKFPTIKHFVRDAVFGPDNVSHFPEPELLAATPEVVLAYLRAAGPAAKNADERAKITGCLGLWFRIPAHTKAAPKELCSAFEDWFVADLEARNEGDRTLSALYNLQMICKANGVPETVGLFQHAGRDGLVRRVKACLTTPQGDFQERVRDRAWELLALLDEK